MTDFQDLYFMLNPALATVKIGIAFDVEARRVQLEHACGVPLVVLGVLAGGCGYEKDLHDAFHGDRLIGEWFNPSDEILALAESPSGVAAFIRSRSVAIAAAQMARADAHDQRRVEREEADRPHREELARIAAEAKRVAREREAVKARRKAAIEKRERERVEAARKEAERQRKAWANKSPELLERITRADAALAVEKRKAVLVSSQRGRNATTLGVSPEGVH